MYERILIIGNPGSGKMTMGRLLAKETGMSGGDIDDLAYDISPIKHFRNKSVLKSDAREILDQSTKGKEWLLYGCIPCKQSLLISRADTVIFIDLGMIKTLGQACGRVKAKLEKQREQRKRAAAMAFRIFRIPNVLIWQINEKRRNSQIFNERSKYPQAEFIRVTSRQQVNALAKKIIEHKRQP